MVAGELAESSSMVAAAFVHATPGVLQPLQGADSGDLGIMGEWVGRPGEQVRPWAALGKRLAHGNWKSVALAASFFEQSPVLLHALPLDASATSSTSSTASPSAPTSSPPAASNAPASCSARSRPRTAAPSSSSRPRSRTPPGPTRASTSSADPP